MRRLAIPLALAGPALAAAISWGPSPAVGAADPAQVRSGELAAAPDLVEGPSYAAADGQARAQAERSGANVPLPEGGTFDGIRWEQAGGVFSAAEIERVLEHNAFCQWLLAAADGRRPDVAMRVLGDAPEWPGLRDDPVTGQVVAEARAGGGAALDGALADCRASAERQARYAG